LNKGKSLHDNVHHNFSLIRFSFLLQKHQNLKSRLSSKFDTDPQNVIIDYSYNKISNLSSNQISILNNVTHLDVSHNALSG